MNYQSSISQVCKSSQDCYLTRCLLILRVVLRGAARKSWRSSERCAANGSVYMIAQRARLCTIIRKAAVEALTLAHIARGAVRCPTQAILYRSAKVATSHAIAVSIARRCIGNITASHAKPLRRNAHRNPLRSIWQIFMRLSSVLPSPPAETKESSLSATSPCDCTYR